MRVAIQNPFTGQYVAEAELAQRICLAAKNLGWEAIAVHTAADIYAFQPDFVIALHNNSPKLAGYPTYGCMWNPPPFFEGTEKYVQHVLSYDGYLTSSETIDRWLHHLLYTTPKVWFTAPFYTSCSQTLYQPPNLAEPHLIYLGSNWDGLRFQALFAGLDSQPYMEVYGNPGGWKHLSHAYKGALPYDGISVLRQLNRAGVGLCLHRAEHRQAALPSMRIFEVVASGAIAICGEHPFICNAFGDSVLYIDPDALPTEQVEQISRAMQWIKANPEAALEKSAEAHRIFLERFVLEKLLLNLLPHHQALVQQKGFVKSDSEPNLPSVQIVLHDHSQDGVADRLLHSLDQIAQQTYSNCRAVVVMPAATRADFLSEAGFLSEYTKRFPIKVIETDASDYCSSSVWAGLQAIDADYFILLDVASSLHANHVQTLVTLLDRHPQSGAAYSGGLANAELIAFQPFQLEQGLKAAIPLGGIMVRRSLLDAALLTDPQLNDYELCFLLHLMQRSPLLFSYELTYETGEQPDRSLQWLQDGSSELSRLRFIFWHQEFAPGKTLQSLLRSQRTQQQTQSQLSQSREAAARSQADLQLAEATIEAMKTSKFWRLRSAWLRAKRAIGLPIEAE